MKTILEATREIVEMVGGPVKMCSRAIIVDGSISYESEIAEWAARVIDAAQALGIRVSVAVRATYRFQSWGCGGASRQVRYTVTVEAAS